MTAILLLNLPFMMIHVCKLNSSMPIPLYAFDGEMNTWLWLHGRFYCFGSKMHRLRADALVLELY
jgi:hypothetical protein